MSRTSTAPFGFKPYSHKQLQTVTWWMPQSPYAGYDMIVADGSIRSGKTISMIDGFLTWSLSTFRDESFILAGRSMGALKRNVLQPMFQVLAAKGISYHYHRSEHYVSIGGNTYYCFGASTEASQDVLQGLTAAGALADEAALFPRSFVDQMIGRCSVAGSRIWLNCNPEGPFHHIKTEFIDRAEEKRILHLHFTLDDNNTLSEEVKKRYKRMYSGVFYRRYILGEWTMAEGVIYDMFDADTHTVEALPSIARYWVGIDYGTSNATVYLLIGEGVDGRLYVVDEWRWDSRKQGRRLTDAQLSKKYREWIVGHDVVPRRVFIDPSAASLIQQMYRDGVRGIRPADNAVVDGIQDVSTLLGSERLLIHEKNCRDLVNEFGTYVWDEKAQERGDDKPVEKDDHALDALRYAVRGIKNVWRRWVAGEGVVA